MAITYSVWQLCYDYIHYKYDTPYDEIRQLPFDDIAEKSREYFFNFEYTLFDESYKPHLEKSFILHFFMYEIGFETVHLFLQQLYTEWIIKIPTYNKFYESLNLITDPLTTVNMESESTGNTSTTAQNENHGTSENESSSDASGTYSDYPQTLLGNLDYATSGTKDGSTSRATSTQDSDGLSTSTGETTNKSTSKGYNGLPPSTLLSQYRNTILNVDMLLFNDLQTLFLGVY